MVSLAGPFFTVAERWLVDACRSFLLQAGAEVFSPFHEIGVGGPEVAKQDLDGLRKADVVLALLDGWDRHRRCRRARRPDARWLAQGNIGLCGF